MPKGIGGIDLMSASKKTALVISGGGAKGAFAVGVLRYLFLTYRHRGWFDITGGTSTGALISPMAALMAAPGPMGTEALETLMRMYTTVSTPDILRRRKIFQLMRHPDGFYDSDPLNHLVRRHFSQRQFDWLQRRGAPDCYVVYTNYQSGETVNVSSKDKGITREKFIKAILASASVPMAMEPTVISRKDCYDGAVRDLLPLGKAIELGAETILPVFLDPEKFEETKKRFKRMDKVLFRTLDIMKDENVRNDYEKARLINMGIQAKEEILKVFQGNPAALAKLRNVFGREEFSPLFGSEKRLIKIVTGLRPDKLLTEDPLTFDPVKMKKWVALGWKKAEEVLKRSPFV